MLRRTELRELLMQSIFSINEDVKDTAINRLIKEYNVKGKDQDFILENYHTILNHLEEIDEIINKASHKWTVSRMGKAELAILRIAIGEGLFKKEVSPAIVINEAVNLGKKYGDPQSGKFINGVLGNIFNE